MRRSETANSELRELRFSGGASQRAVKQTRLQQFDQTFFPVLDVFLTAFRPLDSKCSRNFAMVAASVDPLAFASHRSNHRRMPAVSRHHQRKHRVHLLLQAIGAFAIRFC